MTSLKKHSAHNLTDRFYQKLLAMCDRLDIPASEMLMTMYIESGLNTSTAGQAAGLTQFIPQTLKALNFKGTKEEFEKLDAEHQLDYIEKYFSNLKSNYNITSAAQVYLLNFLPVTLSWNGIKNKNSNTVIARKNSKRLYTASDPHLTFGKVYASNPGLDPDKNGVITYGDIERIINAKKNQPDFQNAMQRLSQVSGQPIDIDHSEQIASTKMSIDQATENINDLFVTADYSHNPMLNKTLLNYLSVYGILANKNIFVNRKI